MYSVVILAALLLALLFLAFAMSGAPVPETPAAPPVPEASATPPVVVPPPQSEAARPVAVEREKGSKKELAAHLAAVEEAQRVSEGNARAARQERPQEQAAVQEARQPERAERREETRGARERGGEAEKPRLRSPFSGRLTLYTTSWCPSCKALREYLATHKINYTDRDIENDEGAAEAAQALCKRSGIECRGVPIIDINGRAVYGFSRDELDERLGGA